MIVSLGGTILILTVETWRRYVLYGDRCCPDGIFTIEREERIPVADPSIDLEEYEDYENDFPEEKHKLKNWEKVREERRDRPDDPEEREKRRREKEKRKNETGCGGADPDPGKDGEYGDY